MSEDFLLKTNTAKSLFKKANAMPIFDWHCHLSPKEIYENKEAKNITELWLYGDHYKWRGMRGYGIDEKFITGDSTDKEKFLAWAKALPYMIGNPLYHWTHLELQRYFDIYENLSENTAEMIWNKANEIIAAGGFTPRSLIEKSNVKCVCTTDDPADSLEYHKLLSEEKDFDCLVLPAFRPDKALNIELDGFSDWVLDLEKASSVKIDSYFDLQEALLNRIEYFAEHGCRATDHALTYVPYETASDLEIDLIFKKGKNGESLSQTEIDQYRTGLMRFLAKEYHDRGWGMEIHIGAMRNNNTRMFNEIGADTGFDSIDDREIAKKLSGLLNSLELENSLPKTILFTLNPKDNYVLGSMLGNFQSHETPSKIQFGTAWWFNDNIDGMRQQIKALANLGVLGKFIGMVTDSRSFLSYPRHEYFRRILCDFIGDLVEDGEYPNDEKILTEIIEDISFNNAVNYFGIDI